MRRLVAVALVAAVSVTLAPTPSSYAAGSFTFFGSGNGHGLGMSQWGAYGLAQQGWKHGRILTHFYRGTSISRRATLPKKVRVGISYDRRIVALTAESGPVRLRLGRPRDPAFAEIPPGQTWTVRATTGGYAIRDQAGALVGGNTWGGPSTDLFATYQNTGSRVRTEGHEYNRGILELNLYRCSTRCLERLIVRVGFHEYLYGLGEVPSSWPGAALRAQAVAARSYAAYVLQRYGVRSYCNCDITDGVSDQVYIAYDKEGGLDGNRWVGAVDGTRNQVVTYGGDIIQAFYASSDGGHSENVEDVWHGGNPAFAVPWLTGVCDPGESTPANPWTDWSRSFSAAEVTARLRPYTGGIGTVSSFSGVERGGSGRVLRLRVEGGGGQATVSGGSVRSALGLPDVRIWINSDRNVLGEIRETYDAVGCRPGLPLSRRVDVGHGAGQRFQVGSIVRNDRAGVTVWLKGPIDVEYAGVGGPGGVLGLPTSKVKSLRRARGVSCVRCSRLSLENGRVYWKAGVGAHALRGPVLGAYLDANGPAGRLGFPTTRASRDGSRTWSASFEHGSIVCPSGAPCQVSS